MTSNSNPTEEKGLAALFNVAILPMSAVSFLRKDPRIAQIR